MISLKKIFKAMVCLLSILVVYGLSVGPVLRVTRDNRPINNIAAGFYHPVLNIGNTGGWPILRTYLRLWGVYEPAAEWRLAPALPDIAGITRFECARCPLEDAVWRSLPSEDGKFIIETIRDAGPWEPKSTRGWLFGRIMPAPADFAVCMVTEDGRQYDVTFRKHAQSFSRGQMVWDVPTASAIQIIQRIKRTFESNDNARSK
jgi:hypothetical protein